MKFKTIIVATKDVMTRVAVDSSTFRVMFGSVVDDVENLESITIYPESEVERRVKERVDQIDAARKAVDIACEKYYENDVVSMIDCENYRRGKPCKWVEDLQKANAELKFINDTLLASEKDEKITSLEAEAKEPNAKIIEMEKSAKELENRLKTTTTLANGEHEKYKNTINEIRKASYILKEIIEKHDRYFTEGWEK